MSVSRFMDRVGDWNPQLLREWRGKLTTKNLIITTVISLTFQIIIYEISRPFQVDQFLSVPYRILDVSIPLMLIIFGAYLLSYNLSQEYQQKTIHFIRLTPQSSQEILIGKILGVPILVYWGLILMIPFHFVSYLSSLDSLISLDIFTPLGIYLLWLVKAGLFYNFSLFYAFSVLKNPNHPYNTPVMISGSIALTTLTIYYLLDSVSFYFLQSMKSRWYGLPLYQSNGLYFSWLIIILALITFLFWETINRQFQNFKTTLISKKQSYQITIFINIFILGFVVNSSFSSHLVLFWLFCFVPVSSLILMIFLFPSRQYLLDWARYGHFSHYKSVWKDFLWGEKSPPIIAVLINAIIPTVMWLCYFFLASQDSSVDQIESFLLKILLSPLCTITLILIYAMIAQILMLNQHKGAEIVAIFSIVGLIFIPLVMGTLLIRQSITMPLLWLFTPVPLVAFYNSSLMTLLLGFGLQLGILILLTAKLKQKISIAGASETYTLLNGHY